MRRKCCVDGDGSKQDSRRMGVCFSRRARPENEAG